MQIGKGTESHNRKSAASDQAKKVMSVLRPLSLPSSLPELRLPADQQSVWILTGVWTLLETRCEGPRCCAPYENPRLKPSSLPASRSWNHFLPLNWFLVLGRMVTADLGGSALCVRYRSGVFLSLETCWRVPAVTAHCLWDSKSRGQGRGKGIVHTSCVACDPIQSQQETFFFFLGKNYKTKFQSKIIG